MQSVFLFPLSDNYSETCKHPNSPRQKSKQCKIMKRCDTCDTKNS